MQQMPHPPPGRYPLPPPPGHARPMRQGIVLSSPQATPYYPSPPTTPHYPSSPTTPYYPSPPTTPRYQYSPPSRHGSYHDDSFRVPSAPPRRTPHQQHHKPPLLRPHRRTKPLTWCCAVLCLIFSIVLILAGAFLLFISLAVKPRHPSFDTSNASLNNIYLYALNTPSQSPVPAAYFFNGDLTLLFNLSNPNHRLDLAYDYAGLELFFHDRLVAAQGLEPFRQKRGQWRLMQVHMISSEVYLPPALAAEMKKEVEAGNVELQVKGTFRVRVEFGIGHISYWLYSRCVVELTRPPNGVLVAKNCRTKR